MESGKAFQILRPCTAKLLSANVLCFTYGTRSFLLFKLSLLSVLFILWGWKHNKFDRYSGASCSKHLNTKQAILNLILKIIGNQ